MNNHYHSAFNHSKLHTAQYYTNAYSIILYNNNSNNRIDNIVTLHVPLQNKCEQYWHDQVDKPFDVGRDFTVVTTAYRGFFAECNCHDYCESVHKK